ncbi:MAG: ABC transporter substrate-binding protein [Gracilibacter sp. BRH_c7a]|nr:MAG: ABC transporter substrate-binding protein [Gracilibacter sp. BRH_c7a]
MKRKISLLIATIMVLTTIFSFGVSVSAAEKTVIKWATQADTTPATQDLIDTFNRSQSKYTVQWVQMTNDSGQMHDQLMTSLSAGSTEYDVISMDVCWSGEFAAAGYLSPLDLFMYKAKLTKPLFNSGSLAAGNYAGKQYALPLFPDLGLLYFRSDIVSKADAEKLVSGRYTYTDLANMAKSYKGKGGTTDGFVYQSKQYEGLTCNVTEFTKAFKLTESGLADMKAFTTSDFVPKNILNYTEAETHNSFINGKSVFARNWPYQYAMLTESVKPSQVGIAPLPNGSTVGGWLLGVNKKSKDLEGAWEFVKFAAGKEGQFIMSTKGAHVPGYNALLTDPAVLKANPMLGFEGFKNAVLKTISRPVSAQYSKASDAVQVNVHKFLSGGQDLSTTVTNINNALK